MAKVTCCRPLRPAVALVALARPAGKLEPPNWHGHGQEMGLGAAVVRLIVPYQGSAGRRHDLPPS